jgi:hypothetical protein
LALRLHGDCDRATHPTTSQASAPGPTRRPLASALTAATPTPKPTVSANPKPTAARRNQARSPRSSHRCCDITTEKSSTEAAAALLPDARRRQARAVVGLLLLGDPAVLASLRRADSMERSGRSRRGPARSGPTCSRSFQLDSPERLKSVAWLFRSACAPLLVSPAAARPAVLWMPWEHSTRTLGRANTIVSGSGSVRGRRAMWPPRSTRCPVPTTRSASATTPLTRSIRSSRRSGL